MKAVKKIATLPLDLLSVFTTAKSFRSNTVIGNRFLNICGLHVARLTLAHAIFAMRQYILAPLVSRADFRDYRRNGFLVKEGFLPQAAFDALVNEARNYNGEAYRCLQGDTITWRAFLSPDNLTRLPACTALIDNKAYINLLKFCSAKNEYPLFYIQQIQNGFRTTSTVSDPQKILHADTFQPTMKAWLFLEDVAMDQGPFTYVPGSNRLTWKRLKWEYKKSIDACSREDGYSEKGSLRIDDAELPLLDLPPARGFAVKANTLVIADTCGFHRRGDVRDGKSTRLEIWSMLRLNPFNPWVGLGFRSTAALRDKIFLAYLRNRDVSARKKGHKASWQKAPPSPDNGIAAASQKNAA